MITIVIPNRNRNLSTVRRTITSIMPQYQHGMELIIVDYGSELAYQQELKNLTQEFTNLILHLLPVQAQLWQKTRAINIALKLCKTPYFMVVDMDMIFHPEFVTRASEMLSPTKAIFYQVGILTEEESARDVTFDTYAIKFKTNNEATGITIFPTDILKSINGFDEFYHGWGAEDTDVHVRLQNAGFEIYFYDEECLFLHQWHPKFYRSRESYEPYHSGLEKINHSYLALSRKLKRVNANQGNKWGSVPDNRAYEALSTPNHNIELKNTKSEVLGFCNLIAEDGLEGVIKITCATTKTVISLKGKVKKMLRKQKDQDLSMDAVNDLLLEGILKSCRNMPYQYVYDRASQKIVLRLNCSTSL